MKPQIKTIINFVVIILVLVLLFLAYKTFSGVSSLSFRTEPQVIGRELFDTLDTLSRLQLDHSALASPLFSNLTNFQEPINPEQAGRNNPFAPIGGDSSGVLVGPNNKGIDLTNSTGAQPGTTTSESATTTGSSF